MIHDVEFLDKLYSQPIRTEYLKVICLNWNEEPVGEIIGSISSGQNAGTLSINSSSSLRRSGSLTLVPDPALNDLTSIDGLITPNRKIILMKGITNNVPPKNDVILDSNNNQQVIEKNYQSIYGDVVWFKLGVFIIQDPNVSHRASSIQVTFQIKDKMCLLNGDCGGTIPATTTLDEYDYIDENGDTVKGHPTISMIIKELVNHMGKIPLHQIIIEMPEQIKSIARYMGNYDIYYTGAEGNIRYYLDYDTAVQQAGSEDEVFTFTKGDDIGYVMTDFIFPQAKQGKSNFTVEAGTTVTSALDKIIQNLGNYEYYFDVDGNFRFEEKKNYLNTTYSYHLSQDLIYNENKNMIYSAVDNKMYSSGTDYSADYYRSNSSWDFTNKKYITSLTNALKYNEIKNDFVIYGERTADSSTKFPIRYHIAIDTIPSIGNQYKVEFYDELGVTRAKIYNPNDPPADDSNYVTVTTVDYREELYYQGLENEIWAGAESEYWAEIKEEFPKIFRLKEQKFIDLRMEKIDWYLDIIDDTSAIGQYSVSNIGKRGYAKNVKELNCVFEPIIPDIILIENGTKTVEELQEYDRLGYQYVQVEHDIMKYVSVGGYSNPIYDRIIEELYNHTAAASTVSIQSIPMYHLEPNTRITLNDATSNIYGDYVVSQISIPLGLGEMTMSASQAIQRL